jgi:hypothetical protein
MRIRLLLLIAAAVLVTFAVADASDTAGAAVLPSDSGVSSQTAVWAQRKVRFVYVRFRNFGDCNLLHDRVKFVLLQLGARASDLDVNTRTCDYPGRPGIDATFSVLTPTAEGENSAAGGLVEAHWQAVELKAGDPGEILDACVFLRAVTQQILPLFPIRQAKLISRADCERTDVGISVQTLKTSR